MQFKKVGFPLACSVWMLVFIFYIHGKMKSELTVFELEELKPECMNENRVFDDFNIFF